MLAVGLVVAAVLASGALGAAPVSHRSRSPRNSLGVIHHRGCHLLDRALPTESEVSKPSYATYVKDRPSHALNTTTSTAPRASLG